MIKALTLAILTVLLYSSYSYAVQLELSDVIRQARETEFLKQKNMTVADKSATEKSIPKENKVEKPANEKLNIKNNYPVQNNN